MATETLIIKIRADGTRQVQRNLKAIGTTAKTTASAVNILKKALIFTAVVQSVRKVVSVLASFSQAISTVGAVTNATAAEMQQLRGAARELGATTRFTATEAAEGLTFLARAGFSVNETLAAIGPSLHLAQAGALDLATAADIASNVLQGFQLEAAETGRVVDVLALAANSSNTNIQQLGKAMSFVAPIAQKAGIELEEAAAAIGLLSNAGIQGERAGTGLRQSILKLVSPTVKGQKALKKLGLTSDEVNPKLVGLATAFGRLQKAGIGLEEASAIFTVRTAGPALVLAEAAGDIDTFTDALNKAEGTAKRVADVMDDNLNGALLRVKSAFEAVILSFGELGSESILTNFMNNLANVLRTVAGNAHILQGILTIMGLSVLPLVVNGVLALTAAIAANPLGALTIALVAVIGFLVAFRDELIVSEDGLTTLGDVGTAVWEEIQFGFSVLVEGITEGIELVVDLWNLAFGTNLPLTIGGLVDIVAQNMDLVIGIFSGVGAFLITAFKDPIGTVGFFIIEFVNNTIRTMNLLFRSISGQLQALRDSVVKIVAAIPNIGAGIADSIANTRVTLPQIPEIKNAFAAQGEAMGNAFKIGFEKSTNVRDFVARVSIRAGAIGEKRIKDKDAKTGPTAAEIARQQEMNEALTRGNALVNAGTEAREKSTDQTFFAKEALGGFREALNEVDVSAQALGSSLTGVLIGAVDALSNAIADAVVNGLEDFESFKAALSEIFKSIAKQIVALIIKFLILKALKAVLGGPGAGATDVGTEAATRAAGGPLGAGQTSVVGENGPELFTPTRSGNVTPASRTAGGGGAVNVTVVNVTNPDEVTDVLNTSQGEQAILNVISKNSDVIAKIVQQGST